MDFLLSEAHDAVRELAERILGDRCSTDRLAALDGWFDAETWDDMATTGLLATALPEECGGGDLGFLAAHLLLQEAGASGAQLPLWETLVLGALPVARFGRPDQCEAILPGVLSGSMLLTGALTEDGVADASRPRTLARRAAGGWELHGVKTCVPIAALAEVILVPAATEEGTTGVWLVDPSHPGVELRDQDVISGQPHAQVVLSGARLDAAAQLGSFEEDVLGWILLHAAAGLASLQAGACSAALRLAAEHAKTREQFGRPIATFQAVAQRLADAFIDAEAARLTAAQAAWRLTERLPARDEVAIARWWGAEAGHRVLHASHHVHGGIGVDTSYPLQRFFRLTKQIEFAMGGGRLQLLQLGSDLAADPA